MSFILISHPSFAGSSPTLGLSCVAAKSALVELPAPHMHRQGSRTSSPANARSWVVLGTPHFQECYSKGSAVLTLYVCTHTTYRQKAERLNQLRDMAVAASHPRPFSPIVNSIQFVLTREKRRGLDASGHGEPPSRSGCDYVVLGWDGRLR